jgi:hypothetical protein
MSMEIVAKHLESEALNRNSPQETDVFGRTAFNRYYYATFWIVRNAIAKIDPKWNEPSHGDLPNLLEGAFINRFRKEIKKAGVLGGKVESLNARSNSSAANLASLMRHAYALRVQADYKFDAGVTKNGAVLVMKDTKTSEAANWPRRAEMLTSDLLNVAKQIGLI